MGDDTCYLALCFINLAGLNMRSVVPIVRKMGTWKHEKGFALLG